MGYADTCEFKLSCWLRNDVCAGQESGAHWILPPNSKKPFEAWCDNEFEDGGWMIVVKIARDQSRDQPLWYATTSACVCYFHMGVVPHHLFPRAQAPSRAKAPISLCPHPPFFRAQALPLLLPLHQNTLSLLGAIETPALARLQRIVFNSEHLCHVFDCGLHMREGTTLPHCGRAPAS